MVGKKEFTNNACVDLNIILTIRSVDKPGCSSKTEEFCLKNSESRCVTFGNDHDSLLDGIQAFSCDKNQYTETGLFVEKCGTPIDKLLNSNYHITFIMAGQSLVISNYKC